MCMKTTRKEGGRRDWKVDSSKKERKERKT